MDQEVYLKGNKYANKENRKEIYCTSKQERTSWQEDAEDRRI